MDCNDIRKLLSDNSEGFTLPEDKLRVDEHLTTCQQCSAYSEGIKKTIETLRDLEELEPPAWLAAKVMKKIREEASPKRDWFEKLFFPLHIKLPLEAFAAVLITVAAIVIYKNMGPELQQIERQSQSPVMKSIPAEPAKEMLKPNMQEQETKQPQRHQEGVKHKDSVSSIETREMTTLKKKETAAQVAIAPAPTPASSSEPSPAPAMRPLDTGKASGMAIRDEMLKRSAPAAQRYELSAEQKADRLSTLTVAVKALDAAKKEIETYVAKINGEFKAIGQSESRIVMTIRLDPAKTAQFLDHLEALGRIKEDRQALTLQSGLFRLIIEKQ